ncbi:hypothetical protein CDQ84_14870 [Clostridium thermosuccinogenes]|uniref:Uncharacterized protein n=1 Tax=Clostridium thermosuccinogenes TaxID=84032 RepID=A0A2K2FD09_9CLOT|nr:hypothetical protein [Pseudoclostridium thermosuccinogenes]AUS95633.1 hypothetical protein CDO33_03780 [Pseudoclostridium thermosuccinogenes]PNT95510.1 hypothetical protein CDQ85_14600 [Pseudoclostridium thermosuccinogenes]PNT96657.1 hypothetical protein CDQ84_14870 [Pseudoclostridium thermosuccinogenes]
MSKSKKIVSVILSCIFIFSINITSFASEIIEKNYYSLDGLNQVIDNSDLDQNEKDQIRALIQKYDLKMIDISDLPDNVETVTANTTADIEKLILEGKQIATSISTAIKNNFSLNEITSESSIISNESDIITPLAANPVTVNGSYTNSAYIGFDYYLNLTAYYTFKHYPDYPQNNYFLSVTGASSYLSGIHPLVGWTQTSASGYVLGGGKGIHAECTGTWDTYIVVPGIGVVLISSTPDSWYWDAYFTPVCVL